MLREAGNCLQVVEVNMKGPCRGRSGKKHEASVGDCRSGLRRLPADELNHHHERTSFEYLDVSRRVRCVLTGVAKAAIQVTRSPCLYALGDYYSRQAGVS